MQRTPSIRSLLILWSNDGCYLYAQEFNNQTTALLACVEWGTDTHPKRGRGEEER
jgi:hypothetical protein